MVLTEEEIESRVYDIESLEGAENKYREPIFQNKVKQIKILFYFVFLQIFFFYSFYVEFLLLKSSIILSSALVVLAGTTET